MAKIRYLVEWTEEPGADNNGDVNDYESKKATKDFPATPGWEVTNLEDPCNSGYDPQMIAAAKYGCERNCYGSKCFVTVEEYVYDGDLFEETGRKIYGWFGDERYLCSEGEIVERVN